MKTFAILVAGAAIAAAQDISQLPTCGQTCINNMLGIATSAFGCASGDIVCYCTEPNFGYGVRDCSNQACSSAEDAAAVIAYGTQFCQQFLASASISATGSGAVPILSSALETLPSVSAPTGTPIVVTSPLVATSVSDDSTVLQTTGFVTITGGAASATDSAGSVIASATDSAGSALSSATESAGSALSSATGSAASAISSLRASASSALESATNSLGSAISSALESATSAAGSAAESATGPASTGGAPIATAMPLVGAAGIAALLLF